MIFLLYTFISNIYFILCSQYENYHYITTTNAEICNLTHQPQNSIFTYRDNNDGKVGIGKIPNELYASLDNISKEYYNMIPDKSYTTHHTYYTQLDESLRNKFDTIQYNDFWNTICDNTHHCIHHNVVEMNEIYYSNPKPNYAKYNLYGAAANLIPHRDCILYNFDGIQFYRIIIGLTENNTDTITEFVNLNIQHTINRGDYMIFDFDKTLHQVKKMGMIETPRILLKIHFIVCENCKYSEKYVLFISYFYILYYYIARYTEQKGTDPTTFTGFFFGLLWEWPFYSLFKPILFFLFCVNIITIYKIGNIKIQIQNISKILFYLIMNFCTFYLCIVLFYYFRYIWFHIK